MTGGMEESQDSAINATLEFRQLNPVSKKAMYVKKIIVIAFFALICIPIAVFADRVDFTMYIRIASLAVFAAVLVYCLVSPLIFYRYYRYRMDDDCIEVRRGVIIRSHFLVPVERIHQVQVDKGPILRKFGLASVTVTTAGGIANLEYLDEPIAEDIAQNLNEKIIKMLKARE